MGTTDSVEHPVILFDGVCNLCNHSVQFIIRHDPVGKFRFAPLQSALGESILNRFGLENTSLNSVLLLKNDKLYQKSNAALEIARDLSGLWPVLASFKIIPPFLRDRIYDMVANHRYRWFGRKQQCMIPTPELKSRFLQ